jgi:isopenicillin-N epimerase
MTNACSNINPIAINQYLLDPAVTYLNHGGFGATPKAVERYAAKLRTDCCQNPTRFMQRKFKDLLLESIEALAAFLNVGCESIALVLNVTHGLNEIASSLSETLLKSGGRVSTTNQEYEAMSFTWQRYAQNNNFQYYQQELNIPALNQIKLVDELWQGVNQHTKAIYFSHINSPTGMIMPFKEICRRAKASGIYTVVDGAHAPGQIDLDLFSSEVDFYTGNLHKWMGVPLTAGFIFAKPELQHLLKPLVVSFGYQIEEKNWPLFANQHYWAGTLDYSAFLSIPAAIKFMEECNWPDQQKRCCSLAKMAIKAINEITQMDPLYPDSNSWYAQMGAARLPDDINVENFRSILEEKYKIEVQCHKWRGFNLIRVCFQAYNTENDLDKLISALKKEL